MYMVPNITDCNFPSVLSAAEMAKVVPAAMDLHNSNNDNNVAAVVAMAHVAHAATALQSDKDKDKATVADLQKVGGTNGSFM